MCNSKAEGGQRCDGTHDDAVYWSDFRARNRARYAAKHPNRGVGGRKALPADAGTPQKRPPIAPEANPTLAPVPEVQPATAADAADSGAWPDDVEPTPQTLALVESWTERGSADDFTPPHGVRDETKFLALVDDLRERGWQGAPVVIADPNGPRGMTGVTGSHRIAAAEHLYELWLHDDPAGCEIEIPYVSLVDLFAASGSDYDAEVAAQEGDEWEVLIHVDDHLPANLVAYLGIDAH